MALRIPDPDQIARYCGGAQMNEDGTANGAAFRLRPQEQYLSVNWLNFLDREDRGKQLSILRGILSSKLKLGSKAKIAVANTGFLRELVQLMRFIQREVSRAEPSGK